MKIVEDIMTVENEILRSSIFNLYNILRLKLPEYFDLQKFEIYVHDDFAEVKWMAKKQVMAEDFTQLLDERIKVHVLFASKEDYGKTYKVEAYSTPVENSMYVIYMYSSQYGIVDSINVSFFDSMEIMYQQLRKDYQQVTAAPYEILEKQTLRNLIDIFY